MDLKLIDRSIESYSKTLDDGDKARLVFFRRLWEVQDKCSRELLSDVDAYSVPSKHDLTAAYKDRYAVFAIAPVEIDEEILRETLNRLIDVVEDSHFFPNEVNEGFQRVNWQRVLNASNVEISGESPSEWLENLNEVLIDDGQDDRIAHLGALLASMALKVQLEQPAAAVMTALKDIKVAGVLSPLLCPACGSAPMMAHVGGVTSSSGRGRLLVCPQCGATWEFERVRCTRCGTQNQGHLHYYNIEGDDPHRIATCDECGGYMRTLFSEDQLGELCSYEVEDVVMAKLDAVAQNPRLAGGNDQKSDAR